MLESFDREFDPRVEKRLDFHNMRIGRPEYWPRFKVTKEPPLLPDVAKALHIAFSGELWVSENYG